MKSDEKCWNLQKEVENISEKIDLKNSDITRLNAEMSMKCEDLGAINSEMMTRYQIIEEMQNSSIELNNDLEKVDEKIEIVEKVLDDFSEERNALKRENIRINENDENKFNLRFEQINMIKVQMREKEEQVKESTSDEKLEINVEQCEVRNFMKEELKVHIRMIHDKGRSVRREDTEEGEDHSTHTEHHVGKQVLRGQHVKNEDGEMKRLVQRFVQRFVQRMFQ